MIDEKKLAELREHGVIDLSDLNAVADAFEKILKENTQLKIVKESLQREADGLIGNCQRWAEKVKKLEAVARAAENHPDHNPAGCRLCDALAALKEKP